MSKNVDQDVAFIRALAELMQESDLNEIEIEREYGEGDQLMVRLSKGAVAVAAPAPTALPAAPAAPAASADKPATPDIPEDGATDAAGTVTSPMVGTVYLGPEPGAESFVEVGSRVSEGQTILIIEAMKTMNQIPAPKSGVISKIMVDNAEPVEFGAPLMVIE